MPICIAVLSIVALLASATAAIAQPAAYPTKPIRIVVAYTPAGATDILARTIGQKLTEAWGQAVIIDNRPGANGNIGTEYAAKATPDGYTLLMVTAGTHGINPGLYRKLGFDAVKDFAPVSLVAMVPNVFVVNNGVPSKDLKEFIAYAKANQGKLNYGSPGNGSTAHLSMELFKSMTGIQMVHVPYKGSAGVLADLIGGQIVVTMDNMPPYVPQVKAGKIRALAVTTIKRSGVLPELPTVAESGLPGYEADNWYGVVTTKGVPRPIIDRLNAEIGRALLAPDVKQLLFGQGLEVRTSTPAEFGAYMKSEFDKWAKVIKDAGITAN